MPPRRPRRMVMSDVSSADSCKRELCYLIRHPNDKSASGRGAKAVRPPIVSHQPPTRRALAPKGQQKPQLFVAGVPTDHPLFLRVKTRLNHVAANCW